MYFKNRESAAQQLLLKLMKYREEDPVVMGIPRGAMPMAKIIAVGLGAELSAVLVHKIPHPDNEEFAIGCIGISGKVYRLPYVKNFAIPETYINQTAGEIHLKLKKRQAEYGLENLNLEGRTVIIVDDGIATGATTECAISEVRMSGARKIVLAAPIAARDAAKKLMPLVDELVVLDIPFGFFGVAQFYSSFPQVSDEEVIHLLHGDEVRDSYQ